jgi:hypothetical protein
MVYRTYDICLLFPDSRQSGVVLNLSLINSFLGVSVGGGSSYLVDED